MWNDRFDDLWLYPMPGWFVRLCNRWIGVHVLELIVIGEIAGLLAFLVGYGAQWYWLQIAGYALIAPGPLLIVMIIITAQLGMRRSREDSRQKSRLSQDFDLKIWLLDQAKTHYKLALVVHNHSARRLLIPWPSITGFCFRKVGATHDADWLTAILLSASWSGMVLQPGESQEIEFEVNIRVEHSQAASEPPSESATERWWLELSPGMYDVCYRLNVDSKYFDPDSHDRLPKLEQEAKEGSAEVSQGVSLSNEIRVMYPPDESRD